MPNFSQTISDDNQDVYETAKTTIVQPANSEIVCGFVGSDRDAGLRFTGVTVPQGATVSAATLTIQIRRQSGVGDGNPKVVGDDADNAAAWSSSSRPSQITPTTNKVSYTVSGAGSKVITITSVVQEILDRGGWSSSNAMRFSLLEYETGGGSTSAHYIDDVKTWGSVSPAQLSITYTVGGAANPKGPLGMPLHGPFGGPLSV